MRSHLDRLTPSQRELWTEWDTLRERGVRPAAFARLRAFIDALKAGPEDALVAWVEALCVERLEVESELDGPEPTLDPMPHPLFIEVVLPVLAARRGAVATSWPRWLAQCDKHVWMSSTAAYAQLGSEYESVPLLRAAVAARPDDRLARQVLARRLWSRLSFAVHEVPSGLLMDPEPMREHLDELEAQVVALGFPAERGPDFARWRRYLTVWERYRAQQPKTRTYAQLLAE